MHIIDAVNAATGDADMPYLDGTGPWGTGPYGRGMGPCRAGGRMGAGMVMGRGRRGGLGRQAFYAQPTDAEIRRSVEVEVEALEARLKYLKEQLGSAETDSP